MPRPGLPPATVEEIIRLYTVGQLTLREIAARTGVGLNRLSPELSKAGVRLRQRGSRPAERLDPQQLRADYEAAGAGNPESDR